MNLNSADENAARVCIHAREESASIATVNGSLYGPLCEYAQTLSASFPLQSTSDMEPAPSLAQSLVVDPCYWTPRLPFQYELETTFAIDQDKAIQEERLIGLRRWHAEESNLKLERRRIVLRGGQVSNLSTSILEYARSTETSVLVESPSDALCSEASRRGVALVVDLRKTNEQLDEEICRLNWYPAVMVVVHNCGQITNLSLGKMGSRLLLATLVEPDTTEEELAHSSPDLLAVELSSNGRPAACLASYNKPIIAIRRGESYADFAQARTLCDRLQADLAPQFDLAGYFVSS